MRHTLVLLICSSLFTSCASIFNRSVMKSTVYTQGPAKIIVGNDTVSTHDNEAVVQLKRRNQPIAIQVTTETESKQVTVKARSSYAYNTNIFLLYGIGYLTERKNPKRYGYPKEIYISDSITLLKRPSPWAVSAAGSYIAMKLADAYNPEQQFLALSLAVSYDITKNMTGRITYSRSNHSHDEFNITSTIYDANSGSNLVIAVDDQWWITDTRFELLLRPAKLTHQGAGLYFTTGLALRNAWHKNILDPDPGQPFGFEEEGKDGSYFYLDEDNNTTILYDGYLVILGGAGYNVRTGPVQLFAEPSLEVSSIPDLLGGGESLSARVRFSLGLTYHFGYRSGKSH